MQLPCGLFLVFLSTVCCRANLLGFLQLPVHDGISRVCNLDKDNFTSVTSEARKLTVVISSDCKGDCLRENSEVLAQILFPRQIRVCRISTEVFNLNSQASSHNKVLIYKNGKRTDYNGLLSPSALLSYLVKVNSTQVKIISGKLDKVAFDAVQQPKMVGLFLDSTHADYKAFEEAATLFTPNVLFYATFDRTVAKFLKLDVVGQVHFYKPMQKTPFACIANPASVLDLQTCVNDFKGTILTKVTEHNINDPQLLDANRALVLAVGEQSSPLGGYLYRLLSKTIRNNTNNTEFQRLNVLWVEPDKFPAVHLSLELPGLPSIGTVSEAGNTWFDLALLNTTADKIADEQNALLLQSWLQAVLNNTLATSSAAAQFFNTEPSSRTVAEGSDFILECRVTNPVGDCLWLHNGQNLGFNMARYGGQYAWAGDQLTGDCSLKIAIAQAGRQDGQWICEMTGSSGNPTITSQPVQIVITKDGKDPKIEL